MATSAPRASATQPSTGGYGNIASGLYSTVAGGYINEANGYIAAILGGELNKSPAKCSSVPASPITGTCS